MAGRAAVGPKLWIMVTGAVAGAALSAPAVPSARADDVEAFLAGTAKSCIACDLSGRDLKTAGIQAHQARPGEL